MVKITQFQGKPCISVKVCPGACKNQIVPGEADFIKVKIHAQPEKGKANEELLCFLAMMWGLKKSQLTIIQGETARNKRIAFSNCTVEELTKKLQQTE